MRKRIWHGSGSKYWIGGVGLDVATETDKALTVDDPNGWSDMGEGVCSSYIRIASINLKSIRTIFLNMQHNRQLDSNCLH
jgi:hypothetical protein